MGNEELRKWVKQKLEDGVDEERVRNVLSSKGYSPSIVDEVKKQESYNSAKKSQATADKPDEDTQGKSKSDQRGHPDQDKRYDSDQEKDIDDSINVQDRNKRHHLNNIGHRLRDNLKKRGKPVFVIVLVAVLLTTAWMFMPAGAVMDSLGGLTVLDQDSSQTENNAQNNGAVSSEKLGDTIEITLQDGHAAPSRPKISAEDRVKFVNKEDYALELSFERTAGNITVPAGSSETADIDSIDYYTAYPVDAEGRKINGGINVQ